MIECHCRDESAMIKLDLKDLNDEKTFCFIVVDNFDRLSGLDSRYNMNATLNQNLNLK